MTDAAHKHEPPWVVSIAAMAGLWLLLAAWSMYSSQLGCLASGSLVLLVSLAILAAGAEGRLLRRHAFARAYLARRGLLSYWLSRYSLLALWLGIRAVALALLLVASLPLLGRVQWLILLVDVVIFAAVVHALRLLLRNEVRAGYLTPLAHGWTQQVNALIVWIALVVSLIFGERTDLGALGVIDAVRHGAASVELGCDALAVLARAAAAGESALWWSAQQLFVGLEDSTQRLLAWAGFVAVFGASFLFAWAWSRALGGVLARPRRLIVRHDPIDAVQDA